jgi:hypothetical protein
MASALPESNVLIRNKLSAPGFTEAVAGERRCGWPDTFFLLVLCALIV